VYNNYPVDLGDGEKLLFEKIIKTENGPLTIGPKTK